VGRTVRVLVVDDHPAFRRAAAAVIDVTPGFQLAGEAESGEAALEAVTSITPELVLMDVNMPGIGGVRAAEILTRDHPGVVVVLVSTDEQATFSCGSCDPCPWYLPKSRLSSDALCGLWHTVTGAPAPIEPRDQGGREHG
jgi:DNA-binding NarL/FixJ family response regulator